MENNKALRKKENSIRLVLVFWGWFVCLHRTSDGERKLKEAEGPIHIM